MSRNGDLFDSLSHEWHWEVDLDFVYQFVSPSIQHLLGVDPSALVGKKMIQFFSEESQQMVREKMADCLSGKCVSAQCFPVWKYKDDPERKIEMEGIAVKNARGELQGFRGIGRVVETEVFDALQKEFLAMIGHEMKAPLTAAYGALRLLQEKIDLSTENSEFVDIAYRNVESLIQAVDNILDIMRGFDNHCQTKDAVHLDEVVREAIKNVRVRAVKAQVTVAEEGSFPSVIVIGDRERLLHVVVNLLSNAVKFSPVKGEVKVLMQKKNKHVRVSVTDQGRGVPKDFYSTIFTRFSQATHGDARTAQGFGLGLYVCKSVIEQLGGKMSFVSEEGSPTLFYFELPLAEEGG